LIHPVTSKEDEMLPPAEDAPAAQAPALAPALPVMASAVAPAPIGEVLEPDLSQLNNSRQASDLQEEAVEMSVSETRSEEKAVPVAA